VHVKLATLGADISQQCDSIQAGYTMQTLNHIHDCMVQYALWGCRKAWRKNRNTLSMQQETALFAPVRTNRSTSQGTKQKQNLVYQPSTISQHLAQSPTPAAVYDVPNLVPLISTNYATLCGKCHHQIFLHGATSAEACVKPK
jgi:hypothetical protein